MHSAAAADLLTHCFCNLFQHLVVGTYVTVLVSATGQGLRMGNCSSRWQWVVQGLHLSTGEELCQARLAAVPYPHLTCGVALTATYPSRPSVFSNQLPYLTFLYCSLSFSWICLCRKKTPKYNPKPTVCRPTVPTKLWWHSSLPSSSHHYSCQCYLGLSLDFVHLYLFQKCQGQPELCAVTMEETAQSYRAIGNPNHLLMQLLTFLRKVKIMTLNSLLEL